MQAWKIDDHLIGYRCWNSTTISAVFLQYSHYYHNICFQ